MANVERGGRPADTLGGGADGARPRAARPALWALAAILAVRQLAVVLTTPNGERLTGLETWAGPFGGLVRTPLSRSAQAALGWGWTFGSLLLVVVLGLVAARALPEPVGRRTRLTAAPVAISLLMLALPAHDALWLGRSGVVPVLLVLLGCLAVRGERRSGVCTGLAAALQPALLLFVPLLWCTRRRRAALTTAVTFAVCTVLARAALPRDVYPYWVRHLAGVGPGGRADALGDQSLHGALLRLGLTGPPEIALFLALGAAVATLALRRAVRYAHDGQPLLAVAVTGCAVAAVSPTAWPSPLLWVLLTMVGRAGRRASDRYAWPVAAVLVTTLPAKTMLPDMVVTHPLRDNLVLVAALAAATAVPFLCRTSPSYRRPIPARHAPPAPARFRVPLLPLPGRVLTRPNLLLELLLIRVVYAAYQQVRLAATGGTISGGRARAEHHGHLLLGLERFLHIDVEHWANHAVVKIGWLRDLCDFYYESFHFVVPLAVLAVLYRRRPADYRWARTSLGFATVLALAGFWLFPLAPPRLMPGLGIVDTVHGPQDFSQPNYGTLTTLTNQYAAMPSLHFGWALWCAVVVAVTAPRWWMKVPAFLHPLFTASAITATGNHWVLDAVGGAAVMGAGFGLSYVLRGPRARTVTAFAVSGERVRQAVRAPS